VFGEDVDLGMGSWT